MSSKFLNAVLAIFIFCSIGLTNNANAGLLLVGDTITDSSGQLWEYVGFFDLVGTNPENGDLAPGLGGRGNDAPEALNGIDAAEYFFGSLGFGELYTVTTDRGTTDTGGTPNYDEIFTDAEIDNRAFYSIFGGGVVAKAAGKSSPGAVGGDAALYDATGDQTVWVDDNSDPEQYINHVFKTPTKIPEPATLAIFSLALFGLGARRLKNSNF